MQTKSSFQNSTRSITQALRWLDPAYPGRRLGLAVMVVALNYGLSGLPEAGIGFYIGVPLLLYLALWLFLRTTPKVRKCALPGRYTQRIIVQDLALAEVSGED